MNKVLKIMTVAGVLLCAACDDSGSSVAAPTVGEEPAKGSGETVTSSGASAVELNFDEVGGSSANVTVDPSDVGGSSANQSSDGNITVASSSSMEIVRSSSTTICSSSSKIASSSSNRNVIASSASEIIRNDPNSSSSSVTVVNVPGYGDFVVECVDTSKPAEDCCAIGCDPTDCLKSENGLMALSCKGENILQCNGGKWEETNREMTTELYWTLKWSQKNDKCKEESIDGSPCTEELPEDVENCYYQCVDGKWRYLPPPEQSMDF